ncbi:unnamed protein product, partial [Scytosiphon promiscuus]
TPSAPASLSPKSQKATTIKIAPLRIPPPAAAAAAPAAQQHQHQQHQRPSSSSWGSQDGAESERPRGPSSVVLTMKGAGSGSRAGGGAGGGTGGAGVLILPPRSRGGSNPQAMVG